MEIDTGAAVTIVSFNNSKTKPHPTCKTLKSTMVQFMELAGEDSVGAKVENVAKELDVYIAKGECPLKI